ncbi:Piso0_004294 [Millerozyma farinosa CBS 7064]|uniref:Piso0_004294 protein n=1 Tax=Pichia sorbitophila (strain ATCC MYA-4447 / BCRC 22081 / CBS 7064 / NBRC 10061 / NRRL Y-12695) TaxID=559304 RepID=G8YB44_PICSO|nr:Piso0_004294 [Millerozyma farinosa CBS 7064]CCE84739.1 Piso0_004294 [Millerozyma farinosa CBS 7064]
MAASLTEVGIHPKRKLNELEDITNNDGYHNGKKMRMNIRSIYMKSDASEPRQQRSPSPSDFSSSPTKPRRKSVSFKLSNDEYANSPLLTPEEDESDYYGETGVTSKSSAVSEDDEANGVVAANAPHSNDKTEKSTEGTNSEASVDLNKNPDYIALTSSLRLLSGSKVRIESEIVQLSNLLESHTSSSKEDLVQFFLKLINNDLNLPKQNKVIKSPLIEWEKYNGNLSNVHKECLETTERPIFKTLNLFGPR